MAIRDDEREHVKTMTACQNLDAQTSFPSPHEQLINPSYSGSQLS